MPKTVGKVPDRKAVVQIGKAYESAGIRLRDIFLSVTPFSFKGSGIPAAMRKVETVVNGLDRIVIKWAPPSSKDAYNEAAGINRTRARALGFEEDEDYDTDEHTRAIEKTQEAMTEDLLKANQSIKVGALAYFDAVANAGQEGAELQAFFIGDHEEKISELIDQGIRSGDSRQKVSQKLLNYFRSLFGDMQFIRINNRNYNTKYYAELVGRTWLRDLQSEATVNMANQYTMDLVEVSDHGTTTEICKKYEGKVYSISGKTKTVAGVQVRPLKARPPFHPNCWHNMFVTSLEAIEVRKKYGQE